MRHGLIRAIPWETKVQVIAMRIYRGRVEPATKEIVEALIREGLVEVAAEEVEEVRKDLESVLLEYQRMEREINERSKDVVSKQGMDYSNLSKIRRGMAQERGFGIEDDALEYVVQQMIEIMMSSSHVDEVFGQDHDINRVISPILKKHMAVDEELDKEVRAKIKHLKEAEGSTTWDVEYNRVKNELEHLKKLK